MNPEGDIGLPGRRGKWRMHMINVLSMCETVKEETDTLFKKRICNRINDTVTDVSQGCDENSVRSLWGRTSNYRDPKQVPKSVVSVSAICTENRNTGPATHTDRQNSVKTRTAECLLHKQWEGPGRHHRLLPF